MNFAKWIHKFATISRHWKNSFKNLAKLAINIFLKNQYKIRYTTRKIISNSCQECHCNFWRQNIRIKRIKSPHWRTEPNSMLLMSSSSAVLRQFSVLLSAQISPFQCFTVQIQFNSQILSKKAIHFVLISFCFDLKTAKLSNSVKGWFIWGIYPVTKIKASLW